MDLKEMKKLKQHCDRFFEQRYTKVLHPADSPDYHIDLLLYEPNDAYPFWKLVTMGAGDYKMPKIPNTVGDRNEYVMFISPLEDLKDPDLRLRYCEKLLSVATYAYYEGKHVTYGHSFRWENEDPEDEMIGAFLEFPQVMKSTDFLRCRLGLFKSVCILQPVLLNRSELDQLVQVGAQAFSEYLYPEDESRPHFLSELKRSKIF